jgi:hypothetical protein
MALDYKKLFIKSIDKIVLLVFVVFLLFQAFKFVTVTPGGQSTVPPIPNKPFPPEPALFKERFVLRSFTNPVEPDARHDLTTDPSKIEPGPTEKQCPVCGWIVKREVLACPRCKYNWTGTISIVPDKNGPPPPPVEGVPFGVASIVFKPVDILFMGFFHNPITGKMDIQINFANNTRTNLIPEGGYFQDYRVYNFEREVVMVKPAGFGSPYPDDRFFVTIQKEGGEPIRVEKGKSVMEELPVATLQVASGQWQIKHGKKEIGRGQNVFDVYPGDTIIELEGGGRSFEVLDVKGTGIRLKDQDGKEYELPFSPR